MNLRLLTCSWARSPTSARRSREALLDGVLGPEGRESGLTQHDLNESSLAQVVDDARSLSLFVAQRVIQISNAEAALPRGKSEEEDDASSSGANNATELYRIHERSFARRGSVV